MAAVIELDTVRKRYRETDVVRDVSLSIDAGETFVLIGSSGSGKSTTMRMINRLVEPTSGRVSIYGKNVRDADAAELRRGIGYVIQEVGLFAHYDVGRNVGVVPALLGWPQKRIDERVDELLTLVGLPPSEYRQRFPRELSGGQRQRAGIARALAADPPIVLLDEPFSALDPITRERLQDEFLALSEQVGKTFVLVTHDIFEAVRLGDRIGVMREGEIVQTGTPEQIVQHPASHFVEALLGRHRYQLRLMTLALEDLSLPESRGLTDARTIEMPKEASVWETLSRMEAEGAEAVRVVGNDAGRVVGRMDLLGSLGGTRGD